MNSTLGSVVPLAMFIVFLIVNLFALVFQENVSVHICHLVEFDDAPRRRMFLSLTIPQSLMACHLEAEV